MSWREGFTYRQTLNGMVHDQSHLRRGEQLWSGPDLPGTRLQRLISKGSGTGWERYLYGSNRELDVS
jgi:signal transduction histidine kinase